MRTTKIYVGNLPENSDTGELQKLFENFGDVKECDIVRNYGFVHMNSEEEAKAAIDGINNTEFMGQKLSVEISHSKVRQRPGMGGKGQCYRCGRQGHWSKECPRNPAARMSAAAAAKGMGQSPTMYPTQYAERFARFGMERSYGVDRGFADQRSFVDRMRPYPDPYERRALASPQDSYMYYRRPYETYSYTRRSPPPQISASRYDFTQDPSSPYMRSYADSRSAYPNTAYPLASAVP